MHVLKVVMSQRLFVYGTLAPVQPNEHLLNEISGTWENATVVGTLHPEGWGSAMGYPAIVLNEGGEEVEGWLFSSDKLTDLWPTLDEFEGEAYRRVSTLVKLKDNSTIDAYVYELNDK